MECQLCHLSDDFIETACEDPEGPNCKPTFQPTTGICDECAAEVAYRLELEAAAREEESASNDETSTENKEAES